MFSTFTPIHHACQAEALSNWVAINISIAFCVNKVCQDYRTGMIDIACICMMCYLCFFCTHCSAVSSSLVCFH